MWMLLAACVSGTGGGPVGPTVAERFGDWPFLTLIDAPATIALKAGGEAPATPETCGGCHDAVYGEWKLATHAAAATDLQYLAELSKETSPRWLCLNCHVPTVPQRPTLVTADTRLLHPDDIRAVEPVPNPAYDSARTADAIGCATCHVRRDADGAGLVVGPRPDEGSPHRVREDKAALDGICVRCHSPGPAVITPQFFCWFQTADEVAAGPQADKSCVDCHMPQIERPVAAGAPVRTTRQHHWVGGGVPKSVDAYDTLLARGWAPGVEVTPSVEAGTLHVRLHNIAGHALPTADPERHLRVEVRGMDGDTVVWRQVRRIGQRWDWGDAASGRPAKRLADERIGPGATLDWAVPVAAGASRIEVEVIHVRMTPDAAAYASQAKMDEELLRLRPTAVSDLQRIDQLYPLASYLWRGSLSADGTGLSVTPLDGLIADSKALAALPLAEKRTRLFVE